MRFASALLAAAGLVATVSGHWLGEISREAPCCLLLCFAV